jgi:hypothetical protein
MSTSATKAPEFHTMEQLLQWVHDNPDQPVRVREEQLKFPKFMVSSYVHGHGLYHQPGWWVQLDKDGFLQFGEGPFGPTLACRYERGFRWNNADVPFKYISSLVDDSDVSDDESDSDES